VAVTVADQNSCIANSSTTREILTVVANVYRSDIGQANCQTSGQYEPNQCYPAAATSTWAWNLSCSQNAGTCNGEGDSDAAWTCTFPLWYVASPTDVGTPWTANNWLASVRAYDKLASSSTLVETDTPREMTSFLAYSVATTSIAYGALEPGQWNTTLDQQSDMSAVGNVGLNQTLYGNAMCIAYPACSGLPADTIPVTEQHYATSSVVYASGVSLQLDPGADLAIKIQKTTATASPQLKYTYWGINIPISITASGNYIGQNSLIGKVSSAADW